MANIKLSELGGNKNSIDITRNTKITEPMVGNTPHPSKQNNDPHFTVADTKSEMSLSDMNPDIPQEEVTPTNNGAVVVHTGHVDMSQVKPASMEDLLPKRAPKEDPLPNELFSMLDNAVEREKKSISERQTAIMEKIYEEEMNAREEDEMGESNDTQPEFNSSEDTDDMYNGDSEDFDRDDYDAIYNHNTVKNTRVEEPKKAITPIQYDEADEEDPYDDSDYAAKSANEEITNFSASDNNTDTTEDQEEDGNRIVRELATQIKCAVKPTTNKVDLSSFKIAKKPISAMKVMKINNATTSTADWVLLSANRSISASALTGTEIINLNRENHSRAKSRLNVFKDIFNIIYNHIIDSNKGDFETWLKTTRFLDLEHIYFALYKATFNGSNFIHYTCPNAKCEKGVFLKDIDFDDMVKYNKDEIKDKVAEILSRDTTTYSTDYDVDLVQVSDNYVFGIRIPSIWNVIIETSSLSESFLAKYGDLIDTVSFIDSIYFINHATRELELIDTKPDKNDQTKTTARKIRVFNDIIKTLTSDQFFELRSKIMALSEENDNITYRIPGATCPYCGTEIEANEMSPDNMLFTRHQLGAFVSMQNI